MEARGRRLAEIRETYQLSKFDFARKLNDAARRLGLPEAYRDYTVSRNESGTISFEDAAVWLSLDPVGRGWDWFVFGAADAPAEKAVGDRHARPAKTAKEGNGRKRA